MLSFSALFFVSFDAIPVPRIPLLCDFWMRSFQVLKLSDELEQLKKRDGDDHPDRPQVDGQQPRSTLELQKDIPAQNEELAACKAEKGRLEGTLEYLRNSLRLADEQRKSNEGKADVLQKELEELKVHYKLF